MTNAPKRKGGPVPSHAARQAAGGVRLDVYLSAEVASFLDAWRGDMSRTGAIAELIRAEKRRAGKRASRARSPILTL